ncbi:gliding motility-associated C-terminal domain-containing protein [Chryseobacterium sp. GP-SGM7]|uniref:T9SS type B sorting domain-containing protein n=1 Tax=Chryseobacterium sp. GP-SGM7 TaxID=3411323 RepID=UPI003B93CD48
MKRFLLSLVLVILTYTHAFGQRDTEHWFAPYFDDVPSSTTQSIYFSTDSVTPFVVSIYNNNAFIGSVTISKNSPQAFSVQTQYIITSTASRAFTPTTMGIYTKADKPYYANLRIYSISHGEIITSKGKAGIGTKFYAAATPVTANQSICNFTTGVLATEDNTSVTVSGYNSGVTFTNNTGATPASVTFVLNKGQSYLLTGRANLGANANGFIGAKIESTKPVSVTNGNSNGQYATVSASDGSDILMDQAVPVDRLGSEFAIIKGNGNIGRTMEGAIVIGTENNTEIFINGVGTSIATINEGQYYQIPESYFIEQSGASGHYNMHIRTSKNVYVYQTLAGQASSNATGGYNYIPPLNCFLPRKIEEIGLINQFPAGTTTNVKLNILTETGATVLVNSIPIPAANGPFPITGTTAWVSYSIPGITGNVTVTSTKAVTAGVSGGYGTAAGFGGYFAGFSSVPVIAKKTGECAPGIILEVDESFETYQWFLNGVAITGATSYTYSPLVAGNYTVRVTMGTCPAVTTPIYKVYSCLNQTVKTLEACAKKTIQPTFTASTQTPVPSTVTIITAPTYGTATVNANGTITYIPQSGYLGNDIIVYKFCGNAPEFVDCEQVTLTITMVPFVGTDVTLYSCQYDTDLYAVFDLTTAVVTNFSNVTKKYYRTLSDLNSETNPIADPTQYQSAGGIVYVKITTEDGCLTTAKITLITKPIKKSPLLVDKFICIDARTSLNAGSGYDSYQWNTGATTSSISGVGVGEYTVILEKNGCFILQSVKVGKAEDPVISEIQITNNTATVIVSGGTPPYKYAVDGTGVWQDSNIFTGLSRGQHTFQVKDFYNCNPTTVEVTVPNLLNAITPNGDNKNDYIDYSELAYKDNLSFMIYDRYGNKTFTGDKFNNYKWDGTHSNKKIVTGTYWYHINWNEPNAAKTPIKYTGWILVKNRE